MRDIFLILSLIISIMSITILTVPVTEKFYQLTNDVRESRHREELLYQECKNLDYEISILTTAIKPQI